MKVRRWLGIVMELITSFTQTSKGRLGIVENNGNDITKILRILPGTGGDVIICTLETKRRSTPFNFCFRVKR